MPSPVSQGPLTLDAIGSVIAAYLPEDSLISEEMVSSGAPVLAALANAAPHEWMPVAGGSIGQGLPVAVGAAVASPDRKVLALEADGSGMYTLQALWTMAREKLNVLTVIFANRRYRILDIEMRRTGANGFGPAAGYPDRHRQPRSQLGKPGQRNGRCRHASHIGCGVRRAIPRSRARKWAASD